jgi:hypothetical protein
MQEEKRNTKEKKITKKGGREKMKHSVRNVYDSVDTYRYVDTYR